MTENFEKSLRDKISQLPRNTVPDRDLWPGIEMAILPKKRTLLPRLAVAASLILAVTTAYWVVDVRSRYPNNDQLIAQLSESHRQQIHALEVAFKNTDSLTDNWQQQIGDLDRAADAIKKALRQDPDNTALLKMLTRVYQQQIDLLERVHTPVNPVI